MIPLKTQAIKNALMGDWSNAITLNEELLTENPDDIDTLNRLAFAYMSAGKNKDAKTIYQRVLSLDIKNPIALRNLKRISSGGSNSTPLLQTAHLFIEESGKTKVIDLINVADKKILSVLRSGEQLVLSVKRMRIFLLDQNKQYVGMLPDDVSKRLIKFTIGGNTYDAYVKTANNLQVTVFVRETRRVNLFKNQPSFPPADKTKFSFDKQSEKSQEKTGYNAGEEEKDYSGEDSDDDLL